MLDRFLLIAGSFFIAAHALAEDLLDPSVAFRTAAKLVKPGLIEIRYDTAPGYYLYRDRLEFRIQPATATLGKPQLPPGKVKQDEFFGKSVIYRNRTVVRIPVGAPSGGEPLTLIADLQGCADIGVCYPPVRRTLPLAGGTGSQ